MSSIFNTPPNTTDPMELLRYFQELRDSRIDTFRKSTSQFPSVFNRPERLAEDTNEKGNNYLASIFDSLSVQTAEAVEQVGPTIARIKEEQKQEQILNKLNLEDTSFDAERMININKTPIRKEVEAIDGSVTDSTNIPGINTITTDGNSAGKVIEPVVEEVSTTGDGIMSSLRPKARPTSLNVNDDIINFIKNLTMSESSGNPDAEITIKDGRTFAGLLQFGEARLTDYKMATGKKFTQKQFKKDLILQQEVALWHIKDIDKLIDSIKNKGIYTNRDGLRAVAHLGGKTGMGDFVKTKGKYNPKDELGTSLQDYYNKYSKTKVANNSLMAKTTPIKKSTNAIKVKKGQTLGGIAKANNTTVAILKKANNIKDENKINVGQSISIPTT